MKTIAAVVVFLLVVYRFGAATIDGTPPSPEPPTGNTIKNFGKSSNTDGSPNADGTPPHEPQKGETLSTEPKETGTPSITETKSTMSTLPLPPENSGFRSIRRGGYFFVDKTHFIKKLIDEMGEERLFFISRPKRFGKSVFLGMLETFFNGSKELFTNTDIFKRGNNIEENGEWRHHPFIYLDFDRITSSTISKFKRKLELELKMIAKLQKLQIRGTYDIGTLIYDLEEKYDGLPVSILIDNYDKPLITCEKNQEALRKSISTFLTSFYDEIRSFQRDDHLRLVIVVGYSKLNILGNGGSRYRDLTFDSEFSSMIGFTAEDVNRYLKPYVENFAQKMGTQGNIISKGLRNWYGGFKFSDTNTQFVKEVLNPASTCQCLKRQLFRGYVSKTEMVPTIQRKMKEANVTLDNFLKYHAKLSDLHDWKYETTDAVPLHVFMLCTGFLAIQYSDEKLDAMTLSFPNAEVRKILLKELPIPLTGKIMVEGRSRLCISLEEKNVNGFILLLNDIMFRRGCSHTVVLQLTEFMTTFQIILILRAVDADFIEGPFLCGEDGKQKGDIDLLIKTSKTNHVIEVKCNWGAVKAVLQLIEYIIRNEQKVRDFIEEQKSTFLVGINVNSPTLMSYDKDAEINEWFSIPYRNSKILVNESVASPNRRDEFITDLQSRLKDNKDSSEVVIWP